MSIVTSNSGGFPKVSRRMMLGTLVASAIPATSLAIPSMPPETPEEEAARLLARLAELASANGTIQEGTKSSRLSCYVGSERWTVDAFTDGFALMCVNRSTGAFAGPPS